MRINTRAPDLRWRFFILPALSVCLLGALVAIGASSSTPFYDATLLFAITAAVQGHGTDSRVWRSIVTTLASAWASARARVGAPATQRGEDQFRGLLESAPDAIVIVDERGHIVIVNSQTERLFGYARAEMLHQPVEQLIPHRFRTSHVGHRSSYLAEPRVREMGSGQTLFGRRSDGSEFPVEISLSPLETSGGRLITAAIRDVTDRRAIERAIQDKNVELENAILAKDRFLTSMSHELRTPLNAVIGFTGTLLMRLPGPLTPDQEAQLSIVQASAKHLLSLINDLLDLAKIDSGKVEVRLEPVACHDVLDDVASITAPLAAAKSLEFSVDKGAPILVYTDRRALSQILINLTGNAVKFTERGTVRLSAATYVDEANRTFVRISVTDTGVGIDPSDGDRLFEAFARIERATARPEEGSGLGLHISQKLAALLGGRLTFTSVVGSGSTFTLQLPLEP